MSAEPKAHIENDVKRMGFQATIDNDTVASMPAICFGGPIVVVDKPEQIEAACNDIQRWDIIGFDTETRPSFKAGVSHKVSLLQLSTPERCYLFRLNRIRLDNRILKILGSKRIRKIGADVAGDIRSLHALRHFQEDGFVDLQHEAPRWGIEEKSLRKLSAIVLGQRVSKAQRLSNWEAGVLTEQQREYAATDAWVCIRIFEELSKSPTVVDAAIAAPAPTPKQTAKEAKNEAMTKSTTEATTKTRDDKAMRSPRARRRFYKSRKANNG